MLIFPFPLLSLLLRRLTLRSLEDVELVSEISVWYNSNVPSLSSRMSSFGSNILEVEGDDDREDEKEAARDLGRDRGLDRGLERDRDEDRDLV